MKKELDGHHFATDDVMKAVGHFLSDQNDVFYTEGIRLLHDHWTKCVNVGGDYVKQITAIYFLKPPPSRPLTYQSILVTGI